MMTLRKHAYYIIIVLSWIWKRKNHVAIGADELYMSSSWKGLIAVVVGEFHAFPRLYGNNGTYLSLQQIVVLSFYTWIKLSGGVGAGRDRSRTWDKQRDIWKANPLEDFFSKCVKYNTGGLTWHHKGACWRSTLRHWSSCSHHDLILHQTWDLHHSCSLSSQCWPCQFRCPPNGTDGWSWWCIFSCLSLQSVLSFWLNFCVQMSVFGLQSIVHVIPLPLGTREDDPWSIIGTLSKMVTLLVL